MTKVEIPLTQGMLALVDDQDAPRVVQYRWCAVLHHGNWYARRGVWLGDRSVPLGMHNFLTGWQKVDHVNGNGLDNRRCNLRPATAAQNAMNQRKGRGRNRFKGVYLRKYPRGQRWVAQIQVEGQPLYLGMFKDEREAALAYDAVARRCFGEYAALNFPSIGERNALDRIGEEL